MLSLTDAEMTRIRAFISKRLSNPRNELEARLFPNLRGQEEKIDYYAFRKMVSRYTYSKENGGFGLRKELVTQLNVKSDRTPELRESIQGQDAVKLYWLTDNIDLVREKYPQSISHMFKSKGEVCDLTNYSVRISIAEEQPVENEKKMSFFSNTTFPKHFRLQNRISVYTEDDLFRIDFTSVKSGEGKTFRESNTLHVFPTHEIEIEYIGPASKDKQDVLDQFVQHIGRLLMVYYDSPVLITNETRRVVVDQYTLLVSKNERLRLSNRRHTGVTTGQNAVFLAANATTLHRENLREDSGVPTILSNYGVTYKADGVRNLLFVVPGTDEVEKGQIYLMNNNFQIISLGESLPEWENTIIEGEYISEAHVYYAYDMLYAKGLDIRNKPLESFVYQQSSRLSYLRDFVNDLNKNEKKSSYIQIKEKPYLFGQGKEIFLKSKELWTKRHAQPYHIDGLIYTPANDPYPAVPRTWDRLFKWKPPEQNTIDVLIEIVKDDNKKDKILPCTFTGDQKIFPYMISHKITRCKMVKMYVSGMIETYSRKENRPKRQRGPVLFKEIKLPLDERDRILAYDSLSQTTAEVMDDTIVEFAYSNNEQFPWLPIKIRHDKTLKYKTDRSTFGNAEHVVRDTVRSIQTPVTEEMITTGNVPAPSLSNQPYTKAETSSKRLPYQVFHTKYVKDRLLREVSVLEEGKAPALIDFGSSRGGDLPRWLELGYKRVVGLDIDPDSIQQSTMRYESMRMDKEQFKVNFICADLSKLIFPNYQAACETSETTTQMVVWKEMLKVNLPRKYMFDVVSSQFVIHYMFKNELSLRTYFQNVVDNLIVGGYFVGSTFDGAKVHALLKRKSFVEGKTAKDGLIWKITKAYGSKGFPEDKANLGMEIDVLVTSIGISHKEYLVNLPYMVKIANEYGLDLVKMVSFSELWAEVKGPLESTVKQMTDEEKQFSFLNTAFVFRKTKQASDALYRKILTLQKKM